MVIDTSAVIALLLAEPEADKLDGAIAADPTRLMSAAAVLEATIVIEARLGTEGGRDLDLLLYKAAVDVQPVTLDQLAVARHAYRSFGKGRHPAALNYGDCFSYALASTSGEPLLFKGDDFGKTDVRVAPWAE